MTNRGLFEKTYLSFYCKLEYTSTGNAPTPPAYVLYSRENDEYFEPSHNQVVLPSNSNIKMTFNMRKWKSDLSVQIDKFDSVLLSI